MDFNPRSLAGATSGAVNYSYGVTISIHAPSRERQQQGLPCVLRNRFQSTLPRGSDQQLLAEADAIKAISIHAPSRERHKRGCFLLYKSLYFNPRSLAGATFTGIRRRSYPCHFNPRSLAGATLTPSNICGVGNNFNPRSLAGATPVAW